MSPETHLAPLDAVTVETSPLDTQMRILLQKHFWCDFADLFPSLQWDDTEQPN